MRVLVIIAAAALAVAANGCYVGADSPAGEADAAVAGEPSTPISDEERPALDPSDDDEAAPPAIVAVCNQRLT